MSEKISVYGSTGFIGTAFCDSSPDEVIRVDRQRNEPPTRKILYLISTVDNYNVFGNPYLDVETNITKLLDVLTACKRKYQNNFEFNFVSSWFVYGKRNYRKYPLPCRENDPCFPAGFYSITKRTAEELLISFCETYGIKYRIFRLTNIIGYRDQKASAKKNAIIYMMKKLQNNEPVELYDNGTPVRDFMHIDDCIDALNVCMSNEDSLNQIINISNNDPVTILRFMEYAKAKFGSTSEFKSVPTPEFHKTVQIKNMILDNQKLRSYGYTPRNCLEDAIDMIVEEMNANNAHATANNQ